MTVGPWWLTRIDTGDSTQASTESVALIHGNTTKRVILPVRRLDLPVSMVSQAIPTPHDRQFVLTKAVKLTEAEDKTRKSLFWHREVLVGGNFGGGRVQAEWNCVSFRIAFIAARPLTSKKKFSFKYVVPREKRSIQSTCSPTSQAHAEHSQNRGYALSSTNDIFILRPRICGSGKDPLTWAVSLHMPRPTFLQYCVRGG